MANSFFINIFDQCILNVFTMLIFGCTCTKILTMRHKVQFINDKIINDTKLHISEEEMKPMIVLRDSDDEWSDIEITDAEIKEYDLYERRKNPISI